jgi:hypothetical protein
MLCICFYKNIGDNMLKMLQYFDDKNNRNMNNCFKLLDVFSGCLEYYQRHEASSPVFVLALPAFNAETAKVG